MGRIKAHFERKFLAGALAAIPVAVTVFILWYIDAEVRRLFPEQYNHYKGVGILIALVAIYVLGVFVTSLIGRYLLKAVDWILTHLPGLSDLYRPWKQIAVTSDLNTGVFARVVMIPDETGRLRMMGFSSGRPIDGTTDIVCVFVPASPNPTSGRLYFVPTSECRVLNVGAQEALKFIISGGNYVPAAVGASLAGASRLPGPGASPDRT
jgi:uncharacterized membrane protein